MRWTGRMKTMRGCRRARRAAFGFSTIEVLVAAGLLTMGLAGLATTISSADLNVHLGGQNSKATALAQQMLETIRNDAFSTLTLYNGVDGLGVNTRTPDNFPLDAPSPPLPGNPGNFQGGTNLTRWMNDLAVVFPKGSGVTGGYGTVLVQSVAQDGGGNSILDKVTVTVYWSESGNVRNIQLTTLVSGI